MIDPQGYRSAIVGLGFGGYADEINTSFEHGQPFVERVQGPLSSESDLVRRVRQLLHDIKAPVTALRIGVSRAKSLPKEERELMVSAVGRVEQIAAGWAHRGIEDVKLSALLSLMEALLSEKARVYPGLNLRLQSDGRSTHSTVRVEMDALSRIISNLIDNSAQAGATEVFIECGVSDDRLSLSVVDNGMGISEALLPILLKGLPVSTKETGMGLGLSHAITCLRSWGGDVKLVSKIKQGTTVRLLFSKSS